MTDRTDPRRISRRTRLGAMIVAPLIALLVAALTNAVVGAAPSTPAAKRPTPTPTPVPTNTPTPTPGCATSFVLASHADRGGRFLDQFLGVAAVSASDVWAVGADDAATPPGQLAQQTETLIEQWNGTAWSIVPSPNSSSGGYLSGVAALSAANVWAVGSTGDASLGQTLIEHWDGATWSLVPSPSPSGATNSYLAGVSGDAANDVWAVGFAKFPGSTPGVTVKQTLIEHWNGASWSIVPSPNFSTTLDDQLTGVVAFSGTNGWAVGRTQTLPYYQDSTLILHWDGTSWTIDSSFSTGGGLLGISAASASDVWAVGGGFPQYTPLVLHNNGTGWSVVPALGIQNDTDVLNGVDALTSSNVWAAGYDLKVTQAPDGSDVYNYAPFVEHWDGTVWSIVPSADPVPFDGLNGSWAVLSGLGAADAADVWAAGGWSAVGGNHSLIEHEVCQ
jgi:hypothetical protein